jgi:hypothetical protein
MSKFIIDLSNKFRHLNGEPVENETEDESTLARILALRLAYDQQTACSLSLFSRTRIAEELYADGKTELTKDEKKHLEDFIEACKALSPLAQKQILGYMYDAQKLEAAKAELKALPVKQTRRLK